METVKSRWDLVVNLAIHGNVKNASESMEYPRSSFDKRLRDDATIKKDVFELKSNSRIRAAKYYLWTEKKFCYIAEDGIFKCYKTGLNLFFNGIRFYFVSGPREYYYEIRNHLMSMEYLENERFISVFNPY